MPLSRSAFHGTAVAALSQLSSYAANEYGAGVPALPALPDVFNNFRIVKGATQTTYTIPFLLPRSYAQPFEVAVSDLRQWRNATAPLAIPSEQHTLASAMLNKDVDGFVSLSTERRIINDKKYFIITLVHTNGTEPSFYN